MNGKQLKNSILQLAIQGKLVPQNPADEPASALLQRIRKEKEQLVKEKKLKKKDLVTTPISDEEKPFEIPESWEWCRIKDILFTLTDGTHSTPKYTERGIPFISVKNMSSGVINFGNTKFISEEEHDELTKRCFPEFGDILLSKVGTTGVPALIETHVPFSIFVSIALLKFPHDKLNAKYLINLIYSPLVQEQAKANTRGVGNKNWVIKDIENTIIPLPPLSEQHRIVAKIEELMPLVEEYDKAQTKLDDLNKRLPEALKKSILQEAIMGKLVAQDPNDEPASVLLQRIRAEKEQLVKDGKLKKKDLVTTPITDEEKPFEIPEGWEWCRLGEICSFLSRGKSPKYSDVPNLYPVFAQKCNLKNGGISLEQARFLNPDTIDKWQETYKLKTGDILVNSTGTGTVCRTRLFHEKYLGHYPFTVPDSHVSVVRTFEGISSDFYYYIFNSKHIQDYWEERLAGSTNQKELYIGTLQNTLIPLPPLSEQHRIVAKIEELLGVLG